MPNMDALGWIVVGFIAGALSGAVVERGPRGCLANTVVGILGGLLGGWFATQQLHWGQTQRLHRRARGGVLRRGGHSADS